MPTILTNTCNQVENPITRHTIAFCCRLIAAVNGAHHQRQSFLNPTSISLPQIVYAMLHCFHQALFSPAPRSFANGFPYCCEAPTGFLLSLVDHSSDSTQPSNYKIARFLLLQSLYYQFGNDAASHVLWRLPFVRKLTTESCSHVLWSKNKLRYTCTSLWHLPYLHNRDLEENCSTGEFLSRIAGDVDFCSLASSCFLGQYLHCSCDWMKLIPLGLLS